MKLRALLLALFCTFASAQDVQETPNLVNMMNWQGTDYPDPSIFSLCCSGGPSAAMNTSTNTLRFSYGLSTAYQMWQIDSVLPGTGIKISGFKYSWWIDNSGETRGTISANVRFASNTGALLENYNYSYGPTNGLTQYSGTELFASPYPISSLGQVGLAFTGKDATWWAGYYGPRVRDPSLSLLYTAGTAPPPPPPMPVPVTTTTTTIEVIVAPTETLVTETAVINPTVAAAVEATTVTTTTLISSPVPTTAANAVPTASSPTPARASAPTNASAVNTVLKNNAAQQAALQSSNLATSIQQSQQTSQQDTSNGSNGSGSNDAVSLGLSSFSTANRQMNDSMNTMDAANPTSTRNLLGMITAKPVDTEQQEREDRQARSTASQSSSASAVGVELGTGASLTAMAVIPQGYASYSMQLIAQTPFYAPKEIYRNQRTVDNDRVRRGLSGRSDRIHQDMVDSQYNRGN